MSMSLFVVLAFGVEPNTAELNRYANELGIEIEYTPDVNIRDISGFFPVTLNDKKSGMEVYSSPFSDLPPEFVSLIPENHRSGVIYQFRFGGHADEAQAAFATAMILNVKYDGVTVEDQAGSLLSFEQMRQAISDFGTM
tara:strand:+ start:196 stop:612 length:417 start_codon:yes stop_codon:yes gene_type:complete